MQVKSIFAILLSVFAVHVNMQGAATIHKAAAQNNVAAIESCLQKHDDVDEKMKIWGYTPLDYAIDHGSVAAAQFLLSRGADPSRKTQRYRADSPLNCVMQKAGRDVSKLPALLLIAKELLLYGADIDGKSARSYNETQSPLSVAIKAEAPLECIDFLIAEGADVDRSCYVGGESGTPLMLATEEGRLAVVRRLLDAGADLFAITKSGRTALDFSLKKRGWGDKRDHYFPITQLLCQRGAYKPGIERKIRVPFISAVIEGNREAAHELLSRGADIDEADAQGQTSLMWAVDHLDEDFVQYLIDNSANVNKVTANGNTALHIIASTPNEHSLLALISGSVREARYGCMGPGLGEAKAVDIARLLLDFGAARYRRNERGWLPLSIAVRENNLPMIDALLDDADRSLYFAELEKKNPLHIAARHGFVEAAQKLLDFGFSTETTDAKGRRPLHIAARKRHLSVVKALIDEKADITALDGELNSASTIAMREGHQEVLAALLKEQDVRSCVHVRTEKKS